jgi:hypothetical protein
MDVGVLEMCVCVCVSLSETVNDRDNLLVNGRENMDLSSAKKNYIFLLYGCGGGIFISSL